MPERIQKIIASHGFASRRKAEQMILDGRVTVDGKPAVLGQTAHPGTDSIEIDGVPLQPKEAYVYIMLNKPRGFVTTMSDEFNRRTVADLVADVGVRVYPVGRLDKDSEGLLLMTNDGLFGHKVAHPSFGKIKTYELSVSGDLERAVPIMCRPMQIDSVAVSAVSVSIIRQTDKGGELSISISEGRNRQIRKMCDLCGLRVRTLKRVSIGNLSLGGLETGKWRHLTPEEKHSLYDE